MEPETQHVGARGEHPGRAAHPQLRAARRARGGAPGTPAALPALAVLLILGGPAHPAGRQEEGRGAVQGVRQDRRHHHHLPARAQGAAPVHASAQQQQLLPQGQRPPQPVRGAGQSRRVQRTPQGAPR